MNGEETGQTLSGGGAVHDYSALAPSLAPFMLRGYKNHNSARKKLSGKQRLGRKTVCSEMFPAVLQKNTLPFLTIFGLKESLFARFYVCSGLICPP